MHGLGATAESLPRSTVTVDGGSGVVWQPDLIVTNSHVARRSRHNVTLWDGRTVEAAVIRRDPRADLALLSINTNDAMAARVGDSSALRPGQIVMAIGNPLGFVGALSTGVVHALDQRWLQVDIRLAPGNSGGPLADASGSVVGINTLVVGRLALAIPSNLVAEFVAGQSRPSLGVVLRPVLTGLLILRVEPEGPAARASLLPADILVGFSSLEELSAAMESSDVLVVKFLRGDQRFRKVASRLRAAAA